MRSPPRFAKDRASLDELLLGAKLLCCPHCGRAECLIGHGFLRGFAEAGNGWVVRGRRFFCSNRHRRPGCGATCSVLLDHFIAGFIVTAWTLFRFLVGVGTGLSRKAAWERVAPGGLCVRSGYRLWRRLSDAQSCLRVALAARCLPPPSEAREPLVQLAEHARAGFPDATCPFSALQLELGVPLLG